MQSTPLVLEFDEIQPQYSRFYVKILHCNADWTRSTLSEIQYLTDYNEFTIQNYSFSYTTFTKYVHYKFELPKVKVSGNYIIKVYRNGDQDDLIITRRFMIYENQINIIPNIQFSNIVENRQKAQQPDFSIDYTNYDLSSNPNDVKVVIRQNYRWDNALYALQPVYNKREEKILDYNFFTGENNFWGLNEFRQFDTRSLKTYKLNINYIDRTEDNRYNVSLTEEKSRGKQLYSYNADINGQFIIDKSESPGNGATESDYANITFALRGPVPEGDIYAVGAFNDYKISESNKLKRKENGSLECVIPLKQGYYNYLFTLVDKNKVRNEVPLENSFNITENDYEIFVYYKPLGTFYDILIGYLVQDFPK
jgi:hypothetical protein